MPAGQGLSHLTDALSHDVRLLFFNPALLAACLLFSGFCLFMLRLKDFSDIFIA